MFGILLVSLGTAFSEAATSIGKWEVVHKKESVYTPGFLNIFWGLIVFVVVALVTGNFVFSAASIPLVAVLVLLEMVQAYSTLHAIAEAERSAMGLFSVLTLPLLLAVDFFLGASITVSALIGVGVIVAGLIILFLNHGIKRAGMGYVIFSTFNAVITISIYKYLITNYNSVAAQQIVMSSCLLMFLFIMARWRGHENPFGRLFKKEFLVQSMAQGIGGAIVSVAYLYAPASIITSGRRAVSATFSIVSGKRYFGEKHIVVKVVVLIFVVAGVVLLAY